MNMYDKTRVDLTRAVLGDAEADKMEAKFLKVDEGKKANRNSCLAVLMLVADHFWNGWLLMFAVALIGFPLGYLPCVLIAYAASNILGTGASSGIWGYLNVSKYVK